MPSDKLNNYSESEIDKKKIIPTELSFKEKSVLYSKMLSDFHEYNGPHTSERLDNYLALPTTEVMKRLKDLGLLEIVREFQEERSKSRPNKDSIDEGAQFELIARFILMEIEGTSK